MSISSIKGSAVGSFSNVSRSSPVGGLQQTPAAKLEGLVSDVSQKLASGDLKGAVEGIKKLCDTLGVDAKKLLGALGLDGAAGGKGGAEGAGGKGGAEGAGGAGGGAPAAGGAEGAGGILELLKKLLQQSPELAKKLLENPELLKQLAENPELLQQLAQNPQALQSLASGAPPELAGISQFQAAAPPAPVSLF
ncbi:hypothetical protein ATI61_11492 [Archangium gephyra]|uniref:STI1 domain-containing protein n=1 Tax=Archangium gephyra TaxID=48 RepID=A0AAC8TE36_9BACT|nr:hypothetical protein [Archangium gephyra]AKJ01201.1 Hypothetical protein AA314_02827 [Archangium gephyra]REG24484.1 hypothetical protein ATI61_11492 [Archangium gephyra]